MRYSRFVNAVGHSALVISASNTPRKVKYGYDYYCDGVNDEVQINSAINYLGALGGGTVLLLPGDYVLGAGQIEKILIKQNNITLSGSGGSTTIKRAATNQKNTIEIGDGTNPYSNITVCNLKIDEDDTAFATIYNYGIFIYDEVSNYEVFGCTITAGMAGVYMQGTGPGKIHHNNLFDMGDESIQLGTIAAACSNVLVHDNVIKTNGKRTPQAAIRLDNSSNCIISGNYIELSVSEGIKLLSGCTNNIVTGNRLVNNGTGETKADLSVDGAAESSIISNNIVTTTDATYAFDMGTGATASNFIVEGNIFTGGVTATSRNLNANALVDNNIGVTTYVP